MLPPLKKGDRGGFEIVSELKQIGVKENDLTTSTGSALAYPLLTGEGNYFVMRLYLLISSFIRPSSISTMRSACSAIRRSWVTMIKVVPVSWLILRNSS